MENEPVKFLQAATRDQLSDCVRLLALNLVDQRAKFGSVPFERSIQQLSGTTEGTGIPGLLSEETQLLEEAFELVKSYREEAAPEPVIVPSPKVDPSPKVVTSPKVDPSPEVVTEPETVPEPPVEEPSEKAESGHRQQLRINLKTPVKVQWADESEPVEVELDNISWGGAAFHIAEPKGNSGDSLVIILPSSKCGSIRMEAKIVRTWEHPAGQGIATRFSMLSTSDEIELENILELLSKSEEEQGQRKHARLTHRLEIDFDNAEELQATLEDISAGGLGITVPTPLELHQSFQFFISTLDGQLNLKLRARAVRQKTVNLGDRAIYRVGLEFQHPSEELQSLTRELIGKIAISNPAP